MKKAELILGTVITIGIIMNLFMIPFAGPLQVISIGTLAMFYMFLAHFNKISFQDLSGPETSPILSTLNALGPKAMGMGLAMTLIGTLFKLMRWPGAEPPLGAGLFLLVIILIIAYMGYSQNQSEGYFIIFKRIIIIGGVGGIFFFLPKYAILDYKYRDYPSYIEAVKKSDADPRNKELREAVRKERMKLGK